MGAAGVVAAERFIGRASIRRTLRPFLPARRHPDLAVCAPRAVARVERRPKPPLVSDGL
jgi:hypothetical protein